MELTIFVPTRGRTQFTPITVEELVKKSRRRAVIVCPPSEAANYRSLASYQSFRERVDVLVCEKDGIGPVRQWIIENSPTRGVVMLDDDLYFSERVDLTVAGPLKRCTDLEPMFKRIEDSLEVGYAHGGISARQGNNRVGNGSEYIDCIRVNNAHFFDKEVYLREGVRFDSLPVMEDFCVTLTLLLRGYPNRVLYSHCWSQRASGFKGGCSIYRTKELQAEAAVKLAEMFPSYVKVVEKTATSGGALFSGTRLDVNIAWLNAWTNREIPLSAVPVPDLLRRSTQ